MPLIKNLSFIKGDVKMVGYKIYGFEASNGVLFNISDDILFFGEIKSCLIWRRKIIATH